MRKRTELEVAIGMTPAAMRSLWLKGVWRCKDGAPVRSKHAEAVARWREKQKAAK